MGQQELNGEHVRINGQEHTTNEDNPRDNTGTCPSTEERLDADDDESTVTVLMEEIIKSRMNLMDPSFDKATDMHPTKKDLRMEQGGDKTETVNGSALQLDDSVPPPHLRRQRALYETLSPGAIAYMQVAREIAERGKPKEEITFDSNVVNINYKRDGEIA